MNEFNVNVGKRIRELRDQWGYSREKFAELASLNDKYLYEVEAGKKGLSVQKLFNISNAFNIPMDFFVTGNVNNQDYGIVINLLSSLDEHEKKHLEEILQKLVLISKSIGAK